MSKASPALITHFHFFAVDVGDLAFRVQILDLRSIVHPFPIWIEASYSALGRMQGLPKRRAVVKACLCVRHRPTRTQQRKRSPSYLHKDASHYPRGMYYFTGYRGY